MIDQYNRDINYLRISITDRCNLRCQYCVPKEGLSLIGHDDILRYEEILRVVMIAVKMGINKVRITGGEPLVRRGVIDFIATLNLIEGIDDISLTTNGILLEDAAERLFAGGVKRINVSLDSLDSEKYRWITRGGDVNAVLNGIEKVHALGFAPIKINIVAIKGFNDDEVLKFAEMTLDRPYQIRFIELMPLGFAGMENLGKFLSNDLIKEEIGRCYELHPVERKRKRSDGPADMYKINGGQGEIGFISPVSHHFCSSCNRLRLTADGHLRACLLIDEEIDLRGPIRKGCTNSDLEALLRAAVAKKPVGHQMSCEERHMKKCLKEMTSIGG
ncbi:MAG: GTP 3',8-cyclase MoaA [Syntrophaceae bacterium]|nr:GTP 3',8-cyclase MoaA [Syntrophaceae bacterium]